MEFYLMISLFSFNVLQFCWLIGFKHYYSFKKAIFLTCYLGTLILLVLSCPYFNLFGLLILFSSVEIYFIYQKFKTWIFITLFYLSRNALMILSWLFTWDLLCIFQFLHPVDPTMLKLLTHLTFMTQQLLFFILILVNRRFNHQYLSFQSVSQLHKKYSLQSFGFLLLLLSFNVIRQHTLNAFPSERFFYLTVILLTSSAIFIFALYFTNQMHQQQQQISILSKKSTLEAHRTSQANEFKHDYQNILLSLSLYLEQNNLVEARQYLSSIINYSTPFTNENFLSQISIVQVIPVQSLLINCFENCQKNKVSIHFSANQEILVLDITIILIDFIRCLSILLDNALEAALNEEQAAIEVNFNIIDYQLFITVSNTFTKTFALNNLLKNDFTTKNNHQGKGLYIFSKLLKKYDDAAYSFMRESTYFTAQFSLPKRT